jgi:stress-induced morphogen
MSTLNGNKAGMPSPDALKSLILSAFPDARVEVEDLTGTQDHFQAVVVTRAFEGKTRVEQHRMVYAALGDLMKGPVHALALTTRTP